MTEVILQQRLLTVEDYHAMGDAGILDDEERVELMNGKIVAMSPIGPPHFHCVNRINTLFMVNVHPYAIVSVQNCVRLDAYNEPEPDVALLRPDLDTSRLPGPQDVLLLVEVADSTLAKDRTVKLPLYAQAGIPEVWIVALPEDTVEVYRQPSGQRYVQRLLVGPDDPLTIEALPKMQAFTGADVLG